MAVRCRSCGAWLERSEIDPTTGTGHCSRCGSIFMRDVERARKPRATRGESPELPLPDGIDLLDAGGELVIKRRWFGLSALFLVPFSLFWNGFMVMWFSIAISEGNWVMAGFGTLHGSVGVVLAYYTVCSLVNTTWIHVGLGRLSVRHKPLPWPGSRELPTSAVTQLYAKRSLQWNRQGAREVFTVMALDTGGRGVKLISGLSDADQALFIEKRVERHLGIEDRPVVGELGREA